LLKKLYLLFFIIIFSVEFTAAQNLTGFWNGKISRKSGKNYGADNFEIHIYQSGNDISGYTFAYSDSSRFVLYRFAGKVSKKDKQIDIQEHGFAYVLLPVELNPCEKKLNLRYTKINNTKYLTGKWSGISIDTTCYAGEELLVAVQKVKTPFFSEDMKAAEKIRHFFSNRYKYKKADPEIPETEVALAPVSDTANIKLQERKLDIQRILSIKDTVVNISLYDNALNDGDTVSVFINKKPFITRQRITNKPISLAIPFTNKNEAIELIFQAENLGEIPPNTGIMIVEADGKRYEIRVQSDFEKHAVIIFTPYK
jgi:hypothetical protein